MPPAAMLSSGAMSDARLGAVVRVAAGAGGTTVRSCGCPAVRWGPVQAEHAQPGQVDRGGQQAEIGGDPGQATHPHTTAAVAAADQVGQLSLHLGSGRAVVGGAHRVGLAGAGSGQLVLVGGDGDGAASLGAGALAAKRAGRTRRAEAGLAVVTVAWIGVVDDRGGALGGAGDRAQGEVDLELVLGEVPAGRDRGLDLDPW